METLKKRAEFLRIRGGARWSCPAFLMEGKLRAATASAPCAQEPSDGGSTQAPRPGEIARGGSSAKAGLGTAPVSQPPAASPSAARGFARACPRFGFTVTKKLGGAVQRNRIRRRLKAAIDEVAPHLARPDCDYVVVAREAAANETYSTLLADLTKAFGWINRKLSERDGQDRGRRRR